MTRCVAVLAAALALVAAGCGGGDDRLSQAEFEKEVVTARDRVEFALARIPKAKSLDEYTIRMEEAAAVIDDAANDLDSVKPPEVFEPETDRLVKSLRQLSVDYSSSAEQIRLTPELLTGTAALAFDSWDQVNLALAGLVGKGIQVRVLQPHLQR